MTAYSRYVGLGEETTYATAVAVSSYFDIVGETMQRKPGRPMVRPERRLATMRQLDTGTNVEGSIDLYCGWAGLGKIFKGMFGAPTTTGPVSGDYLHTYDPTASRVVPTWTLDIPREVDTHRFTGVQPKAMRFSMGVGDLFFGVSLDCIGASEVSVGSIADVAASAFELPIDLLGKIVMTLETDAGPVDQDFQTLDLNIKTNRKLRWPERASAPTGIVKGDVWGATLKAKWIYNSDTEAFLEAFRDQAWVSATIDIGPSADGYSIQFVLPNCRMNGVPPTIKGPGYKNIDLSMDFVALWNEDESEDTPILVSLTNGVSSY